jgi:hypothetical protein
MYVEIIPSARPVRTRVAGTRGKADDGSCGIRAVQGQVLLSLEDLVRLDLVPLED